MKQAVISKAAHKAQLQYDFSDKQVLVTGAANGIGRAAAIAFADAGALVLAVDMHETALAQTVASIRAHGGRAQAYTCDISDSAAVQALFARIRNEHGRLDFAFNNAGIEEEALPLGKAEEEQFDRIMRVNLKGAWLCMRAEIGLMLEGGGGAIVNTASVAGLIGAPLQSIYAASMHAVVGLTKSAAVEYGPANIRINTVCPGVIDTGMMERALAREPNRATYVTKLHPIGRVGQADEIAQAALWLCSDAASFVTGHQLTVDGGLVAI